jgi:hypothetical protein
MEISEIRRLKELEAENARRALAEPAQGHPRPATDPGTRKRTSDDQQGDVLLESVYPDKAAFHSAGQADPECLCRVIQWTIPGWLSKPALVPGSGRCPAHHRWLARALQCYPRPLNLPD